MWEGKVQMETNDRSQKALCVMPGHLDRAQLLQVRTITLNNVENEMRGFSGGWGRTGASLVVFCLYSSQKIVVLSEGTPETDEGRKKAK
jgi:hypothetical protein